MRDSLQRYIDSDPMFRWRGESVTRIENLSDIVFALALGMLVSASSPPQTYNQLLAHLWQIVPVFAGFAILVLIWNSHFVFFRRYGLADQWIVFLNASLLLVVLFIAYPLRFIFDGLFGYLLGLFADDWSRTRAIGMGFGASSNITALFSIGYSIVFMILAFMYGHALRKKDALGLNKIETILTRRSVVQYVFDIGLGLGAAFGALFTPAGPFAAFILSCSGFVTFFVRLKLPLPLTGNENDNAGKTEA